MKIFTYFKKMNKLGAAMVEYAVILAFVAAVGSSFTDNISPGVNNIIKSVSSMLGLAAGSETQQSAKDIANDLFTNKLYGVNSKDETFGKLIGLIWSGSSQSIPLGAELCAAGIDTLFAIDNLVPSMGNYKALVSKGLLPENAKFAKLITIADQNGLDSSANAFSATQYLCHQVDGKLVLAATRKIDGLKIFNP